MKLLQDGNKRANDVSLDVCAHIMSWRLSTFISSFSQLGADPHRPTRLGGMVSFSKRSTSSRA